MSTPKIKWKMAEAPTGRFRSFQKRGWPEAVIVGTEIPMISISCEDSYTASAARDGTHRPLIVRIADWTPPTSSDAQRWCWRKLKTEFNSLEAAKVAAIEALTKNPDFWPTGEK